MLVAVGSMGSIAGVFRSTELMNKPSQVFYLHFALKGHALIEEFHEKQGKVKEWLQNLGIGEHTAVAQDEDDPDDDVAVLSQEERQSARNRNVSSSAALPIFHPALGRQHFVSDRSKVVMQGYVNHFLGNLDVANSRKEQQNGTAPELELQQMILLQISLRELPAFLVCSPGTRPAP